MKYTASFILAIVLVFSASQESAAWEGFDWNIWQQIRTSDFDTPDSPQSGTAQRVPLLQDSYQQDITTIAQWETQRDHYLDVIGSLLGSPANLTPPEPVARIVGRHETDTYIRIKLDIITEPDEWIPAYMLFPKPLPTAPTPTMIVLHQTVNQGKDEAVGIQMTHDLDFAVRLVNQGFITMAYDAIGYGERTPPGANPYHDAHQFYLRHPKWSFMGKMVWDFQRVVDYLMTVPEVDPYRIGSIGHSHGAYGTLFCTAFEPRIQAAVASGGFTTLRADPSPHRWSHLTPLIPSIGFYLDDIKRIPFDFHQLLACIAPRPLFVYATLNDEVFPNVDNFPDIFDELEDVYSLYHAADDQRLLLEPGRHSFREEAQQQAYDWLKEKLPPRVIPDSPMRQVLNASSLTTEEMREQIRQRIEWDLGASPAHSTVSSQSILTDEIDWGYRFQEQEITTEEDNGFILTILSPEFATDELPGIVLLPRFESDGVQEASGRGGDKHFHVGAELARRGYSVFIPSISDILGEGSTTGTTSPMAALIQRTLTTDAILRTHEGVLADRIAIAGIGRGALVALHAAPYLPSVQAIGAIGDQSVFAPKPLEPIWASDNHMSLLPAWRVHYRADRVPPWSLSEVFQRVAPTPTAVYTWESEGKRDSQRLTAIESMQSYWAMDSSSHTIDIVQDTESKTLSPLHRESFYKWLDATLKEGMMLQFRPDPIDEE